MLSLRFASTPAASLVTPARKKGGDRPGVEGTEAKLPLFFLISACYDESVKETGTLAGLHSPADEQRPCGLQNLRVYGSHREIKEAVI